MAYPSRGAWLFHNITRDYDFWPKLDSIQITQSQPVDLASMSGTLVDKNNNMVFLEEDKVWAKFRGTKIFAGHVKTCTETYFSEAGPRAIEFDCQDYTAKLDDSVIDQPATRGSESNADRVAWILSFLNFTITTTNVTVPSGTAEEADFDGMTVREALQQSSDEMLCYFYLDFGPDDSNVPDLHYFRTETINAPFALNDLDPDYDASFPYTEYRYPKDTVDLATSAYVQGETGIAWVDDTGAIATYGRQERTVNDESLKTATAIINAGTRSLDVSARPLVDGTLTCWEPGLRAGMTVNLVNDLWERDENVILQAVSISAVDPHDASGKAYLKCEIQFSTRHRRHGGSNRDANNKNARKRKGVATREVDTCNGPSVSFGTKHNAVGLKGFLTDPPIDSFNYASGGSLIESAVTQNTGYTGSGCELGCGLYGPGATDEEGWYPIDGTDLDDTMVGFIVHVSAGGSAQGQADGGVFIVGFANSEPSAIGAFSAIGSVPVATGGDVLIPRSFLDAAGDNFVVIGSGWHASAGYKKCARFLLFPCNGPIKGGEGGSGSCTAPTLTGDWQTLCDSGMTQWLAGIGAVNGTNRTFTLIAWNGNGVPSARVGAIILTPGDDYFYDRSAKTVTLNHPPPTGSNVGFRYEAVP